MGRQDRVSSAVYGIPRESLRASFTRRVRDYFLADDPNFWVGHGSGHRPLGDPLHPQPDHQLHLRRARGAPRQSIRQRAEPAAQRSVPRDFWGLPPDRSVGSYRPLPNLLWRLVASGMHALHDLIARLTHVRSPFALYPWVFHWCNVILHAANGALLVCLVFYVTRRRGVAWLAGAIFVGLRRAHRSRLRRRGHGGRARRSGRAPRARPRSRFRSGECRSACSRPCSSGSSRKRARSCACRWSLSPRSWLSPYTHRDARSRSSACWSRWSPRSAPSSSTSSSANAPTGSRLRSLPSCSSRSRRTRPRLPGRCAPS